MSHISYSTKQIKEPIFCKKMAPYSPKTNHTNARLMMDQFMFRVLSTMRAKPYRVVQTRNVKTASYQFLLEEEMVPNAGKHFSGIFLSVHNNVLAHRATKFP